MILQNTEGSFIGRVNGILMPLFMGAMVVTMSISGWIKQVTSITTMYEISAVLFLIGIAVMLPILRLKKKPEPVQPTEAVPGQK
jgi:hypothetical protein